MCINFILLQKEEFIEIFDDMPEISLVIISFVTLYINAFTRIVKAIAT